jgi:hypothetical protein
MAYTRSQPVIERTAAETARIARPKPSASASVKSAGPCTWRTAHRNVQPTSGEGSG